MFFICKLNPSSYFLSLLIWTADCTQFLSENHLNGCQICGQFGCFKTESETIFSFLHSCYIPHSAYFVHLRYTMGVFCASYNDARANAAATHWVPDCDVVTGWCINHHTYHYCSSRHDVVAADSRFMTTKQARGIRVTVTRRPLMSLACV